MPTLHYYSSYLHTDQAVVGLAQSYVPLGALLYAVGSGRWLYFYLVLPIPIRTLLAWGALALFGPDWTWVFRYLYTPSTHTDSHAFCLLLL